MQAFVLFMLMSTIQILESASKTNTLHDIFKQALTQFDHSSKFQSLKDSIPSLQTTHSFNMQRTNIQQEFQSKFTDFICLDISDLDAFLK